MDLHLLNQADIALSKCGRPVVPLGRSVVPIQKSFVIQGDVAVGQRATFYKTITGEATWALRAISIFGASIPLAAPNCYVQVQLPNGRFLQSAFQDITQLTGFGSWRFTFTRELDCVPGSKIQVTLDDVIPGAALPQVVVMVFEGAYKYYLESRNQFEPRPIQPRYTLNPNQNILAPCWMCGDGPATPPGYVDRWAQYASTAFTATIGGTLAGTVQLDIDNDSSFHCRKIILNTTATSQVTNGTFLGLIRLGSGYALNNDYTDLRMYLQNAAFAHDWDISASERVFVDLQCVDAAGQGSLTTQVFLEGVKRRRIVS